MGWETTSSMCSSKPTSWRVGVKRNLPHNLVLIRSWTCFGHGRIRKLIYDIHTTIFNHFPSMVRMMGTLVVAIEEHKYPTFFMVVFPW
jgi:hypothetical protein